MANWVDFDAVTQDVADLLAADKSGHGMAHVERVLALATKFAQEENANEQVVILATLLHDVDDYKLFGQDSADNLTNARQILDKYQVEDGVKAQVLDIIYTMGYNRYLEGVRPATIEGMIVSDADMCDAIGATGILRTHAYALSKGNEFFLKDARPITETLSAEEYRAQTNTHSVQHFFDKLLKIPTILMSEAGKKEGAKRKSIMVSFLNELFEEEDAGAWIEYLKNYEN